MSTGAFSIDQLMELAGLSVSQAGTVLSFCKLLDHKVRSWLTRLIVYRVQPPSSGRRILVACGPGNNGVSPSLTKSSVTGPRADFTVRWRWTGCCSTPSAVRLPTHHLLSEAEQE